TLMMQTSMSASEPIADLANFLGSCSIPEGLTEKVSKPHLPRPILHNLPQPHAVARGNAKQLRPARNEISFVFMQDTIGEHDFPKHFDDTLPSLLIKLAAEHAREAIEINRVLLPGLSLSQDAIKLVLA